MSNQIERFEDPGLPAHVHRNADSDPLAAKRAERQVAILFMLSALGTVLTIAAYIYVKSDKYVYLINTVHRSGCNSVGQEVDARSRRDRRAS